MRSLTVEKLYIFTEEILIKLLSEDDTQHSNGGGVVGGSSNNLDQQ